MSYRIIDEPVPGNLQHLVVDPIWPLFALMFGGFWLALPWMVFNAFAMGSPLRMRTAISAGAALLLLFPATLVLSYLAGSQDWDKFQFQYGMLLILGLKLGAGYYLTVLQSRSFDLYEHFGGTVRNGIVVVIAGTFLRGVVLENLPIPLLLVLS